MTPLNPALSVWSRKNQQNKAFGEHCSNFRDKSQLRVALRQQRCERSRRMGSAGSRAGEYIKLTPDQRALVKQVWIGVENNPQFHGSVFFTGFCEIYPRYTKYFTNETRLPLNFDARTNAKFTVIMETMGYLLLDFHNKPKQLDRIIGYVALVHKDMSLTRSDMFIFGVSLLEYLSVTFPTAMTPECSEVVSKYMNNLLSELSQKIEDFKKDEILGNYDPPDRMTMSCGQWLLCRDNLVYGQSLHYWKERKNLWNDRLNEWNSKDSTVVPLRASSTDEEETSLLKSRTEDETSEFAESTARLLESHGIPRKTEVDLSTQRTESRVGATGATTSGYKFTDLRSERPPYQNRRRNDTVRDEGAPSLARQSSIASSFKTPREKRRISLDRESNIVDDGTARLSGIPDEEPGSLGRSTASTEHRQSADSQVPLEPQKIDSIARQRRRKTRDRAPQARSPSVYF